MPVPACRREKRDRYATSRATDGQLEQSATNPDRAAERRFVLTDAVVDGIDGLNEAFVHPQTQERDFRIVDRQTEVFRDDLLAKVLVNQSCTRELGDSVHIGEVGVERTLMMVEAEFGRIVDASDIHHDITRIQHRLITSPDQLRVCVVVQST